MTEQIQGRLIQDHKSAYSVGMKGYLGYVPAEPHNQSAGSRVRQGSLEDCLIPIYVKAPVDPTFQLKSQTSGYKTKYKVSKQFGRLRDNTELKCLQERRKQTFDKRSNSVNPQPKSLGQTLLSNRVLKGKR